MECDNEFERALLAAAGMDFATWRARRPPVFLVSVAMWANYLRHLAQDLPVRDLAARAGDDDAAIHRNLNGLGRWRACLTPSGAIAQQNARKLVARIERRWRRRLGAAAVAATHRALDRVVGDGSPGKPPLAEALAAPPGLWRSAAPTPTTLPHHPMPLGRGGWPDGA